MNIDNVNQSKFLSYILRHKPDSIGLTLDAQGWAKLSDLIKLANKSGQTLNLEDIFVIVKEDAKGRFSLSEDRQYIRAVQGHSLKTVDLKLTKAVPPPHLLHGTAKRFIESINTQGLIPKERQYVHLTEDINTARLTGMRYGKPVVLNIDSQKMQVDGYKFYQAENNVWLTVTVPSTYITVIE